MTEETENEKLKAFLRIRPLTSEEAKKQPELGHGPFEVSDNLKILKVRIHPDSAYYRSDMRNSEKFSFSRILKEDVIQAQVFRECLLGDVKTFLNDRNVLICAYGITNSGKSYTVRGDDADPGLIPRAAALIYRSLLNHQIQFPAYKPISLNLLEKISIEEWAELRKPIIRTSQDDSMLETFVSDPERFHGNMEYMDLANHRMTSGKLRVPLTPVAVSNNAQDILDTEDVVVCELGKFTLWCSFAEVYNNSIFDLLSKSNKVLIAGEDADGCPYIKGLTQVPVYSASEVLYLLKTGCSRLRMAETKCNRNSSRSHSIFNLTLMVEDSEDEIVTRSFTFCDLAGAERARKAGGSGVRLKEACVINTSLTALHRCIECLRKGNANNKIKPSFRESKITRILQPFLEGRGVVRLVATISLDMDNFDETLSVLRFVALAQEVAVAPREAVNIRRAMVADCGRRPPRKRAAIDRDLWRPLATGAACDEETSEMVSVEEYHRVLGKYQAKIDELEIKVDEIVEDWVTQMEEDTKIHREEVIKLENLWKTSHERKFSVLEKNYQKHRRHHKRQLAKLQDELLEKGRLLEESNTLVEQLTGKSYVSKVDDQLLTGVDESTRIPDDQLSKLTRTDREYVINLSSDSDGETADKQDDAAMGATSAPETLFNEHATTAGHQVIRSKNAASYTREKEQTYDDGKSRPRKR